MKDLEVLGAEIGGRLIARGETVAVAESTAGGLISAALLAMPGASKYYLGGAVVYTGNARTQLLDVSREAAAGMRSATEPYALLLAQSVRERLGATWGISETGIAGPTGNPPGRTAIAVAGPVETALILETGSDDRSANMRAFAARALELLGAMMA